MIHHEEVMKMPLITLYRVLIKNMKYYPSKNKNNLLLTIRDEFRQNKSITDERKLFFELKKARIGVVHVLYYKDKMKELKETNTIKGDRYIPKPQEKVLGFLEYGRVDLVKEFIEDNLDNLIQNSKNIPPLIDTLLNFEHDDYAEKFAKVLIESKSDSINKEDMELIINIYFQKILLPKKGLNEAVSQLNYVRDPELKGKISGILKKQNESLKIQSQRESKKVTEGPKRISTQLKRQRSPPKSLNYRKTAVALAILVFLFIMKVLISKGKLGFLRKLLLNRPRNIMESLIKQLFGG